MKFKNATKKIAAVSAAVSVLASSAFAGLTDYPNNFVKDGKFVGQVVVGSSADVADSNAASALIDDLKADLGSSDKVKITYRSSASGGDSVEVSDSGKTLNFGETLASVKTSAFDEDDSDKLQDETLKLKSSEDYSQEITVLGGKFEHALRDDLEDEISSHIYFEKGNVLSYKMALDSSVDLTDYADKDIVGKTITIMGNKFTIGSDWSTVTQGNAEGLKKLKLLGGSNKVSLGEGESNSVTIDGKTYDIAVQSVSSDKVLLTVNGQSKSIDEYDSEEVAGVNIVVTDVHSSSRDSVKGYAEIVVGGNELLLEEGKEVKLNEEKISDVHEDYKVTATFQNTNDGGWDGVTLTYQWDNSDGMMLKADESFEDKVFQAFSLDFEGLNDVEYSTIKVESAGTKLKLSGDTVKGETFSKNIAEVLDKTDAATPVTLIGSDKATPMLVEDIDFSSASVQAIGAAAALDTSTGLSAIDDTTPYKVISDGNTVFIGTGAQVKSLFVISVANTNVVSAFKAEGLADGTRFLVGDADNQYMYEVTDFDDAADAKEFDFDEILRGSSKSDVKGSQVASKLKEIASFTFVTGTPDTVTDIESSNTQVGLAMADEVLVDLTSVTNDAVTSSTIEFTYDDADVDADDKPGDLSGFTVEFGNYDTSDKEFSLSVDESDLVALGTGAEADIAEDNDDVQEFVTKYGSKVKVDAEDNEWVEVMTPNKQVEAEVMLNFGGSTASTMTKVVSADSVADTKSELEKEGYKIVGTEAMDSVDVEVSAPMSDAEVSDMSNMIVVGGPAVNSAARKLLGIEDYSMDQAGVAMGEGRAKYFADSNSLLVYGYSAADTKAIVDKVVAGSVDIE